MRAASRRATRRLATAGSDVTWQKHVRLGLMAVIVALAGGIGWYVTRDRAVPAAVEGPTRTDPEATTEIANEEFTRTEDGKVVFTMTPERVLSYPDGRVTFLKLTATFARGEQAPLQVAADEADIVLKSGAGSDFSKFDEMTMRGNVVIKGGDDLHMATSEAHYNDVSGIVTTDKPATIRREHLSGSGTGATFDRDRSVVWLLADAKVAIETEGQGTLEVTSSRAGLAQAEGYMRFEENVRMTRDGQVIETDAARADLTEGATGLTKLELRGNSRITGDGGGGDVPEMAADDITMTYGAETGLLEHALLERAARVGLPGGAGRTLSGDTVDMTFAGDAPTLTALDASGSVAVHLPAEGDDPATDIRAPRLVARGTAPAGLERATFTGGVEFRERAPAARGRDAVDRLGRSETLVLALDGGFDDIKDAAFTGNVRFRDADVTAEAPQATYGIDTDRIALRGGRGISRVVQEDSTVQATDIDLTLDPRNLQARGNVRSTLSGQSRGGDDDATRPSILKEDQPANVTAAALDYDGRTERATYTGDARLWQGDTVIQGETIVLDDKTGNLEARTNVRAQFLIRDEHAAADAPKPKPTLARADDLVYVESRRQATLRENARITGPDGDITGKRIELFLQEDGETLDRAEAYDDVTARLDGGRVATGSRLVYTAGTRRYDMRGTPLRVKRQFTEKGSDGRLTTRCEETVGSALTFDRSADTVSVVGADGAPSRTVPVPCAPGGTRP